MHIFGSLIEPSRELAEGKRAEGSSYTKDQLKIMKNKTNPHQPYQIWKIFGTCSDRKWQVSRLREIWSRRFFKTLGKNPPFDALTTFTLFVIYKDDNVQLKCQSICTVIPETNIKCGKIGKCTVSSTTAAFSCSSSFLTRDSDQAID